ncbi:MAG TPA: hypothetical protein VIA07_05920 [Desulfuromonadales bacterium]|jgi:hypothetical protein
MTQVKCGKRPEVKTAPAVGDTNAWKRTVARTFLGLGLIPDQFNGELVITFKDGGVSYLKKTETFK